MKREKKNENKGKRRMERRGNCERTYVIFDVDDEREDLNNHGENWKRWYLSDLFSLIFFISNKKQLQLQIIFNIIITLTTQHLADNNA